MSLARWGFVILLIAINLPFFREFMSQAVQLVAAPWFGLWNLLGQLM